MASAACFCTMGPNENLDIFDSNNLQTNEAFRASCGAVIDRLVKFIQNSVPLKVKEIVKGGSLGKGTAMKDKSDIDLVLFLVDYPTVQSVRDDMDKLLTTLETYLVQYNGCRYIKKTGFSLQINVSCHASHEHDVDILPVCDVLGAQTATAVYQEMAESSEKLLPYFKASFVKLQVNFVKELPVKAMSLIRLVKYWRKSDLPSYGDGGKWPSSYILELITIKKWEDAGRPLRFDLKRGLHSVLTAIANYRTLNVVWFRNYDRLYMQFKPPYVIDPANPFNNIMDSCDVWEKVALYALTTLQCPLFRGLGSFDTW